MKRMVILGLLAFAFMNTSSAGPTYYIWMYHEGDFVQYNVPMGSEVQIKVWAGGCANGSFDYYDNCVRIKKEVPKTGSIPLPLSGGVYKFVNREGASGYSTNSDIEVEIPANAFNGSYKHTEKPANLCGTNVTQTFNLPPNWSNSK